MTMRKIQVFLRADQKAALRTISARTGRKQSDLIRKGVDLVIEQAEGAQVDWREATRAAAGMWRDRTDLEALTRELRAAARRRFPSVYDRA